MPQDFYKVGSEGNLYWDTVGLNAYARDCAAWPGAPGDDLMHQSQFTLFGQCQKGVSLLREP